MEKKVKANAYISEQEAQTINDAIGLLEKGLPKKFPLGDVRRKLVDELLIMKETARGQKKRHGNAGNFRFYYFPLVEALHKANENHQWTFKEMTGCIFKYLEKAPKLVPRSRILKEHTIQVKRLPKYQDELSQKLGIVFVLKTPANQLPAKLPI